MRLSVVGGLCNRIGAILGHRAKYGPLTVVWRPDEYVAHGRWADVLQPLEGVTFVDDGPHDLEAYAPPVDAPEGWDRAYGELRHVPLDYEYPAEPYDAVHIRRTDFHRMVADYHNVRVPSAGEILAWARESDRPIWLATDNAQTQDEWRERLQGRCLIWRRIISGRQEQAEQDHHRHTSLAHAVVDIFICVAAARFMGSTSLSTFTATIERLRLLKAQT